MAEFKLEDELDKINFDFRPEVDCYGTVPEPSDTKVTKFSKTVRDILKPVTGDADATNPEVIKAAARVLDDEKQLEMSNALFKAVAELCSNQPNYTTIKKLPFRGQKLWLGYIMGIFTDPKA
jgi:hypothetical protein